MSGKLLLIYICNFHVSSHLLLIYICKLHWNPPPLQPLANIEPFLLFDEEEEGMFAQDMYAFSEDESTGPYVSSSSTDTRSDTSVDEPDDFSDNQSGYFLLMYMCYFHVLSHLLLNYICKLHWNLNTMFVCQVNYF
jgi:hypothetical protein